MNKRSVLVMVGILLLLVAVVAFNFGCATKAAETGKANTAQVLTTAGGDGAYYCPMHPDQRSDDPNAACSICGMRLERRNPAQGK